MISLTNHKSCKAKDLFGQGQGLLLKAKAKDSKFVLEDISRPKDQGQGQQHCLPT